MNTKATATYLYAVAYKVVCLSAHLFGMLVKQRNIVGVRHGKGMVCCHETLFFVAPLEEREVDNPQALKLIFVAQTKAVAHFQTQCAKLHASLIGIVATENKHEVAILGTHFFFQLLQNFCRVELVDAALYSAVGIEFYVYQALCAYLRTLYKVGQLVKLFASIVGAARHADTAYIVGIVKHRECASAFQCVHKLNKLHTET